MSVDGQRLAWTNTGPKSGKRQAGNVLGGSLLERANGAAVLIKNGTEAYAFGGPGSTLRWLPRGFGKESQEIKPPANLPEFSMGYGLAWDRQSSILGIVTLGDQGYFYRYDTQKHSWLSARPLQNRGILSIAFDSKTRTYVGISQYAKLVIFNELGEVQKEQSLADRLVDLRSTFDRGIPHADGLTLALHEGAVAIINVRKSSVTHIWTHELGSDRAQLTYKAGL
ncbi:hypothetical protein [Paucibacter sp. DJ2R-2]|uniref:hypothetical protein n=1 Tax=Paucibacter sp. DJ2R-2 TaxID=2893558 RepID=UPI0021E4D73D|nr:hypothetical protein [Paucibacter sp. DJ2R-2]MCV2438713.1 hypothetical protein [Paucibacter sp. DJ2R-2]